MDGMRRGVVLMAILTALAGCEEATGPEVAGQCIAVVNVDGAIYKHDGETMGNDFEPGQLVMTVSARTGCNDTVVGDGPVADNEVEPGESNFLPEGTGIHVAPGYTPEERLVADAEDGWLVVIPDPNL